MIGEQPGIAKWNAFHYLSNSFMIIWLIFISVLTLCLERASWEVTRGKHLFMWVCVLKFTRDAVFQKYFSGFRLNPFLIWIIPKKHNVYGLCWIYKSWIKRIDNCIQCDPWRSPFLAFWHFGKNTLSVLDYGYINNILKKRNTCTLIEPFFFLSLSGK